MIIEINNKTIKVNTLTAIEKVEKRKLLKKMYGIKINCTEYFRGFTNKEDFVLFFKNEDERNSAFGDLNLKMKSFLKDAFHEQFKFTYEQKVKIDKRCLQWASEMAKNVSSFWQGSCFINDEAEVYLAKKVEQFLMENKIHTGNLK